MAHLSISWWAIVRFVVRTRFDAQWDLIWTHFFIPDLPCAVIHLSVLWLVDLVSRIPLPDIFLLLSREWVSAFAGTLLAYVLPITAYGIFGPIMYLVAPSFVYVAIMGRKNQNRVRGKWF